jgi:hypothetical protein
VSEGGAVAVAPDDTDQCACTVRFNRLVFDSCASGRNHPTVGKLVGLNKEEFVIEVKSSSGTVRCHFPRLGFTIKMTPGDNGKL